MTNAIHMAALAAAAARHPRAFNIAWRAIRRFGAVQRTYELTQALVRVGRLRPSIVVEVGSHLGGTLHAWASAAPLEGVLVSVDIRPPTWNTSVLSVGRQIVAITGDSRDPATRERVREAVERKPVDFLFIDGDHSDTGVRADLRNFAPLVREGGLIGLHDIIRDSKMPDFDVWKFWNELRRCDGAEELVDAHGRRDGGMGIGLLKMTRENAQRWTDSR